MCGRLRYISSSVGAVAVVGAGGGQFFGGLIIKKCRMKVRGLLRFNAIALFSMLALDSVLLLRCDRDIAGVNVPYSISYVFQIYKQ